jgi:PAS domain S-box-containing protein
MQPDLSSASSPPAPKANILLVDDHPANLLALEALLDDLGHNLVRASSGEEALRLLADRDFAVVLLDVQMHGLDGFETAKRIRGRDRSRHTPIIFLTAHDDNRLSPEEAYALGAVDYLQKPIVPIILRAKVAGFVELFQKTEQVRLQAEQLRQLERREFERKLAEENARYRALTEHSSDAVTLLDPDGTILYSSPSSLRVLGYGPDEFIGRSCLELVHPDDRERIAARLTDLGRAPGATTTVEMRARHQDGSWRWVECVGTNLLAEPAVKAIVVNYRDITERRRTTEALRDSEERFRQLAENINAVFWMTDPQKDRILYVSPAYETVWGRPRSSLYEQPLSFLDAVHPDDRERVLTWSLEPQARGETTDVEYRVVRPDGSIRWMRDRGFPVRGPSGEVYRMAGIAEDITERKQAEASLYESEQRLRAILDNWPSVIFVKDLEGRYLLANRACEGYSGEPPERMLGKTDYDYFPREIAERYRADDLNVLHTGTAVRYEESGALRGEGRASLTVKFPLCDAAGRPYAVCGIATDITDLKRAEQALKEADRRKDEFLAMLAHELRNPLAPIRNAVQVMNLLAGGEPNLQRAREMIERQVKHLARLVDDLLDVSRITRGKINIRKEPVELASVIARAAETSRPLLETRRQALAVTLLPEPVLVEGDATRLAQVFANLLNNAAKYTNEGGRVTVTVERAGGEVVVRVRDTGIGIPAELLPRVFDLFTQGDRSLARSEGGLGIGLTLVRRLVEMHGGRVEAFSDGPGKGSEFVVRLPILERRRGRRTGLAEAEAARPQTAARRILVVDDNQDAAESLALLLRAEGHEVRTAPDGATALDLVPAYQPEVVLLDIGLPKMDGYEVARRLRAREGGRCGLLVALTGYGQEEDRRRATEAGFDAHLVKPADLGVLHELLRQGKDGAVRQSP